MNIRQEKRTLLIGIDKLQRQCSDPMTSTIDQIELLERIRTLTWCLIKLNWNELDRRKSHDI
jgi:hypothetical protein